MSRLGPSDEIAHPALRPGDGPYLGEARLRDQDVVAVVLQGAALLAHLDHGGWHLEGRWEGLRIEERHLVRGLRARPGQTAAPTRDLLIHLLLAGFRGEETIAGRGVARRAARRLLERWRQPLAPVVPDRAVADLLEEAPFLWRPGFAGARQALGARLRRGDSEWLWVAGPGPSRDRVLEGMASLDDLARRLAAPGVRGLWEESSCDVSPLELARRGRWRQAVAAWGLQPPASLAETLAHAECLFSLGRFESALDAIQGQTAPAPEILRLWCQLFLGELGAARETLRRLSRCRLRAREVVECAEAASRVLANSGDLEGAQEWIARARSASRRDRALRLHVEVIAAFAAWDEGKLDSAEGYLAQAAQAQRMPALAWKWHQARALQLLALGDGGRAADHLSRALREERRRLRRVDAAALWNDLTMARVQAGDLAGAERACLHAVHLLGRCQGPRQTTLALHNLAEVRLRLGRLAGVQEILEDSLRRNRDADNLRAWVHDNELWARYELVGGRPEMALERCQAALERLRRESSEWRRGELQVLAARALGWMGRREEAAAALLGVEDQALEVLETEERPAVWALAGRLEMAERWLPDGELGRLWRGLVRGNQVHARQWGCLESLEPFRAARLVFDLHLLWPGAVPRSWIGRAESLLKRLGADRFAARLEGLDGPWEALTRFLEEGSGDPESLAALFTEAGFWDVSLRWQSGESQWPIVDGRGGADRAEIQSGEGRLVLEAERIGPPLRALLALAAGRFEAPIERQRRRGTRDAEIVGESPELQGALERVARFAPGEFPVLIVGESGTGKELFAHRIHSLSPRRKAPFLPVNCAALPETLVLSDLFGHARGAFTGADRDRAGVFETARGGTVFLDEIGDLPLPAQGLLLRVLQEGEVRRVGESTPRRVDVRVVAATHRNLQAMVRAGTFRQDLYFRLKVASVSLPPLRVRGGDVILLAERFLAAERSDRKRPSLSPAVRRRLLAHEWPGNVRELENVLAVARALAGDGPLRPEHLDLPERPEPKRRGYHEQVEELRRQLVREALEWTGGNRAEAARRLGLSRQALSYLVRKLSVS